MKRKWLKKLKNKLKNKNILLKKKMIKLKNTKKNMMKKIDNTMKMTMRRENTRKIKEKRRRKKEDIPDQGHMKDRIKEKGINLVKDLDQDRRRNKGKESGLMKRR